MSRVISKKFACSKIIFKPKPDGTKMKIRIFANLAVCLAIALYKSGGGRGTLLLVLQRDQNLKELSNKIWLIITTMISKKFFLRPFKKFLKISCGLNTVKSWLTPLVYLSVEAV